MRKITPEKRLAIRNDYIKRIMNVLRIKGFSNLTIQDLACYMNISRASLYNYFSSKEEIIIEVTDYYLSYIREADDIIANEQLSYQYRLQKVFEQAVLSAIYASDIYLRDLKAGCPALYRKMQDSQIERRATTQLFYQKGMKAGIFNTLNPALIIMQDEATLKKLVDTRFLYEINLTMKQALYDYYEAKKHELLKPASLTSEDDNHIHEIIDHVLYKLGDSIH